MTVFDKHRPLAFADLVFATPQLQSDLQDYAEGRRSDSLLLYGPYGTGKSTIAEVIQRELLIAAGSPNAPYVIEPADWSSSSTEAIINQWNGEKIRLDYPRVVINEFDQLKQKQLDVRALYDKHAKHGFGFIVTTNYLHEIDPGFQSRLDVVEVPMPPPNAWVNRVIAVLAAEGLDVSPSQALRLAQAGHVSIREIGKAMDKLIAKSRSRSV
ncbi:AAA family ATPase [Devosia sp. Root105]|uniref:AAA family ATPase n=1 Tax=Devosia sp. Root105 TaxID=1736423 RepID=UPI0006F5DFD6|nr:AAA family ATPase [Devosia sp. Root105]KQU93864.1 hypothetical protein ASC68_19435 [Devosia sp. Root105]